MTAAAKAEAYHQEIRERADAIEVARRMPHDLATNMASDGLFRLLVPEQYGGLQIHPNDYFATLMATSRADGAVGWCQMIHTTTGLMSASLPDQWSQVIYADDPNVITSGVTAPMGRAIPTERGWQVSGRWPFASGCELSQWMCGGCVMHDEHGKPKIGKHGRPETALVFFPAEQVTIHDTWHTSGLCGTGSHHISVHELLVPDGRWVQLGRRARVDAPLYRFPTLALLALGASAVALGIAAHAKEAFMEVASDKVPTGGTRRLAERDSAQKDLARATASLDSALALTHASIDRAWEHAQGQEAFSPQAKASLRLAATNNAWSAVQAVDLLYHAAGGSSIYQGNPLQRCLRDIHVVTQHTMVAQATLETAGKAYLGIDLDTPF
jgi:alkylation response protein AidB-like acyl-CoA dehydrogenase